jgi:ATP-dependent Clp protease ATP-binding subunit ClpB
MRRRVLEAMDQHFRPEFLNRIDEIIIFHSLTREHLVQIVDIQLERLQKLLADRKVELSLTEVAKRHLAEKGFDPMYGARPLKRTIQRELQDPLAMRILQGEFSEGDKVHVDLRGGQLVFEREEVLEKAA